MSSEIAIPWLRYVDELGNRLGLTSRQIAAAIGTGEEAIHGWHAGTSAPEPASVRKLEALYEFQVELLATMYPDAARGWLYREVPDLGGRRPIDLITAGEAEALTRMLLRFNLGISS